jgi:V-type H+-transporting ATPase 16kDa proteolipid subunit
MIQFTHTALHLLYFSVLLDVHLRLFLQVSFESFNLNPKDFGSAYGIAKGFIGVAHCATIQPAKAFKSMIPCIMSAVLGIYGLIVSIIIAGTLNPSIGYSSYKGYSHAAAGLICGLSCLASGMSMGIAGDAQLRVYAKTEKIYVVLILIQCFQQALALYGVICGILIGNLQNGPTCGRPEAIIHP